MDANAFGLKDAPAHIQAMHKAILQRTGIDHAVNTLTIAFDSALGVIKAETGIDLEMIFEASGFTIDKDGNLLTALDQSFENTGVKLDGLEGHEWDLVKSSGKEHSFLSVDYQNGKANAVLEAAKTIVSQIENGITPTLCPSSVAGDIDPDFEDALDQIRNWPISRSYILLFEFIKHKVWRHGFGQLSASSVDDGAVEYTFTTGGWSENEEILEALKQQRLAWALTWQRSERGGKHVFRVNISQ